jgi:hypothetical protein
MKKIQIKDFKLDNLSNQELLELNGGTTTWYTNPITAVVAGAAYLTKAIIDDWACFKDGLLGNDFNHQ